MTTIDLHSARPPVAVRASRVGTPGFAIGVCVLLACALTAGRATDVWNTGAFFDTDDATRALQVRAWLAGQGWFDLAIARMDPAAVVPMHWSRIVDLPLAAMEMVARRFLDADLAERAARIVFPAGLLAALLAASGWAAGVLDGVRARIPAICLCFGGAPFFGQFVPGRIDHHAPQILLLVLMSGATMAAFDPRRWRWGALAGLFAALSLSISLENLPFIAIVGASYAVLFVLRGREAAPALLAFSVGLSCALIALFFATIGPAYRGDAACDAYSIAHLAAGLAGCAVLVALASGVRFLRSRASRAVATAALAFVPLVALRVVAPSCLGDPFAGLDPLVRDVWLHNVAEVEPLVSFARSHPWSAITIVAPMLFAIAAAVSEATRATGVARGRTALLAVLLLASLASAFWGIRTLSSGLPLIAVAAAPFVYALAARLATTPVSKVAALAFFGLPFAPLAYAYALPSDAPPPDAGDTLSCLTPDALAPLAHLPPGIVLAPIDAGAHLLAFTPHDVLGAPYHRNNHGNRLVLDALLASPDAARDIVRASRARYIAVCADQVGARILAQRAPDGLAAKLLAGNAPAWVGADPAIVPRSACIG